MLNAQRTIALAFAGLLALQTQAQPAAPKPAAWYISHAPFSMPPVVQPQFPQRDFRITDYGAIADGHTLNTDAFAKAMKACYDAGGGHVIVPAGTWLTGPIEFMSHVDLQLEKDAIIQFSKDHTLYLGEHGNITPPVYGHDLDDIAITGEGTIDGAGEAWRPVKQTKMTDQQWQQLLASGGVLSPDGKIWWPSQEALKLDRVRPYMVSFSNCRHVLIQNVLLRNSPKFVFYPQHCTDLTVDHARIFNEWWAQNGDGIDISACKRVLIYGCTVSAGDDGICMKSSGGPSPDGPALEDIVIAGCTVLRAHGGFVIGSNTDGGMHDIFVSDCSFLGTDVGLRFKSNMGRGGLVNDIFVDNITMRNIVNEAVLFDTYYEDVPAGATRRSEKATDKTPEFRDFHLRNIDCQGAATAIAITGLPQMPVSHIAFDSVTIKARKGLTATQCHDITLHDVRLAVDEGPAMKTDRTADVKVVK